MGPIPIHFRLHDFILLVGDGSSCTLAYSPKSILKWIFKSNSCLDIISRGEYTLGVPVFSGKLLIHNAVKYTNSMMTCLGTNLNGSVFSVAFLHSFTTLISIYIYPKCSHSADVLTVTCKFLAATGSNSMSINHCNIRVRKSYML